MKKQQDKNPCLIRKKSTILCTPQGKINYGETASSQKSKSMYKNNNSTEILGMIQWYTVEVNLFIRQIFTKYLLCVRKLPGSMRKKTWSFHLRSYSSSEESLKQATETVKSITSTTTQWVMTQDEVEVVSRGLITKQAQAFTIYPRVNGKPLDKLFRKLTHFYSE